MQRTILFFIVTLLCETNLFAQTEFDETAMENVQALIMNKEHDKADSILNYYQKFPQGEDASFLMDLTRSLNGYYKIQTVKDVSIIVHYSEAGKRAFTYIKKNINEDNASQSDCWPILTAYAEIFNYTNDGIIDDIATFSGKYFSEFKQKNLYSYYTIVQNTYQHHFSRNEWQPAIDILKNYNRIAIDEKDSTMRTPISSAFIGSAYLRANNYKEATKWLSDSYKRFKRFEERKKFRAYCELLSDLAYMNNIQGKYKIAYEYALEACETNRMNYGKTSSEYLNAWGILSDTEMGLNKTDLGLGHLEEIVTLLDSIPQMHDVEKQNYKDKLKYVYLRLNIKKDVKDNNSITTENSIILDASEDFAKGRIENAISKFSNILDYYNNHFHSTNIGNYIFVVCSLSNALVSVGSYSEADNILNETIEIFRKNNVNTQQVKNLYEAKGLLYYTLNNVNMALKWYNQAKDMYATDDKISLQYGLLISNIAACHLVKKDLLLAKSLSDMAYDICFQFYGDNNNSANDRLLILNNLATIYTKLKDYSKGKELYMLVVDEATSQHNIGAKALALINLSEIHLIHENDYHKAEEYLCEALKMDVASYIKDMAEMDLLFVQILQNQKNAVNNLESYNNRIKEEVASMYAHFSEVEREEYWTQKSQNLVFLNNLSAMTLNTPKTLEMAYDNAIYTKSMLINSGRLLGQLVINCNADIHKEYSLLINLKKSLFDKNCTKDSIEVYREEISQKEKAIVASIPHFGKKLMAQFKTCGDVQRILSDNEIAIEFVFLPQIKPSFNEPELLYGALLLIKGDTVPRLIPLCSEYNLEDIMDSYSSMDQFEIDSLYAFSNKTLYHMIWEKLEPYIPIGSTVYYSPTGYISKINLSAISNGNKRLSEVYSLHEVSTTALIDEVKQNNVINIRNATLYGDINYYEDVEMMAEKAGTYSLYNPGNVLATCSLSRGSWDLLPGTKEEVETVNNLLKAKHTNVYMLTQNDANEESFKALDANAPELIHIATHGFYFSPEEDVTSSFFSGLHSYTQKDYSMHYSGLMFAGGNNAWTGKEVVKNVEDGILTADEISRLDLSGNKLIVLSACNSGLGDIDKVDGVFGLQRGLKKAGTKTILMSLWKVPDEETKELMAIFYRMLLAGNSPHYSLEFAKEQIKNTGKSPYYWAGFILLD